MAYHPGVVVELRFPFTFVSGTLTLNTVEPGNILDGAWVRIDVPFDDPAAAIHMGTVASPNAIFAPGDITPTSANEYTNQSFTEFLAPDALTLFIAPAASTQGSGTLIYRYRS